MPRNTAPLSSEPKVLADWLERRVGGRKQAQRLVHKLAGFYINLMKKETRLAATKPIRSRRHAAAASDLRR